MHEPSHSLRSCLADQDLLSQTVGLRLRLYRAFKLKRGMGPFTSDLGEGFSKNEPHQSRLVHPQIHPRPFAFRVSAFKQLQRLRCSLRKQDPKPESDEP